MNSHTDLPPRNVDANQPGSPRQTTHLDWRKGLPEYLTAPSPRWKGLPPTGSYDPAWVQFQRARVVREKTLIMKFAADYMVTARPGTKRFDHDLLVALLGNLPAFDPQRETRGAKQKPDADPESIARRKRRESRKTDK